MNDTVAELLADIAPGDRFDVDVVPAEVKQAFLDEFYGNGFVINSDGIVGQVEICPSCDGEGFLDRGKECLKCDGFSQVVDWGRGWKPYRE